MAVFSLLIEYMWDQHKRNLIKAKMTKRSTTQQHEQSTSVAGPSKTTVDSTRKINVEPKPEKDAAKAGEGVLKPTRESLNANLRAYRK